jgi:LacI family transcriptional regulator
MHQLIDLMDITSYPTFMSEAMKLVGKAHMKAASLPDWRGPSIAEIAKHCRVGTATVDRVLNGRNNVREITRQKVLAALEELRGPQVVTGPSQTRRIAFLSESGSSFNQVLEGAVEQYRIQNPLIECAFFGVRAAKMEPIKFANLIERTAETADALIIVARDDLIINRAIRNVMARKVPVICLTSDLPNSGRAAYVGSDQAAAGATAAYLMGQMVRAHEGKILLIYSAPYRAQEERELGFRRVLRADFGHLQIEDRVKSNDDADHVYRSVMAYLESHGTPAGIYNTVGGNSGIGRAMREHGILGKTVFIGHELNPNSRQLLETGVMNFAIGHDVMQEVEVAVNHAAALIDKRLAPILPTSKVRIYTRYNCN